MGPSHIHTQNDRFIFSTLERCKFDDGYEQWPVWLETRSGPARLRGLWLERAREGRSGALGCHGEITCRVQGSQARNNECKSTNGQTQMGMSPQTYIHGRLACISTIFFSPALALFVEIARTIKLKGGRYHTKSVTNKGQFDRPFIYSQNRRALTQSNWRTLFTTRKKTSSSWALPEREPSIFLPRGAGSKKAQ